MDAAFFSHSMLSFSIGAEGSFYYKVDTPLLLLTAQQVKKQSTKVLNLSGLVKAAITGMVKLGQPLRGGWATQLHFYQGCFT